MRDLLLILGVCALALCLCFSVGCTGGQPAAPGCCDGSCCPNCPGGGTSPLGQCQPCQPDFCPPGQLCPGGQCPLQPNVGNIEIGEPREGKIDIDALTEPKTGECVSCPRRPSRPAVWYSQPQPTVFHQPAISPTVTPVSQPASTVSEEPATKAFGKPFDGAREGAFACDRCRRATVGEEWKELWTDDDTPLTCLCQQCWRESSAIEKREILNAYVERSELPASQEFYCNQLIGAIR